MLRFLALFLLVWLSLRLLESGIRRLARASSPEAPRPVDSRASRHAPLRLVRCEHCGVRVPENQARRAGGGFACAPHCLAEPTADENHVPGAGREAS